MPAKLIHIPNVDLYKEVPKAKAYYEQEYRQYSGSRRVTALKSIKYFDLLLRWYDGATPATLSEEFGIAVNSMRNMLIVSQRRVEVFLKLQDRGAL